MQSKVDVIGYSAFGKKEGFQFFYKGALIEGTAEMDFLHKVFCQLDLHKMTIPQSGVLATQLLQLGRQQYFLFGLFLPAKDAFNRAGYYGASLVLVDHYVGELCAILDNLERLAGYARRLVGDEPGDLPELEPLTLKPYPYQFTLVDRKKPTVIDISPSREKFIEMAFRNQLGQREHPVFFATDTAFMESLEVADFTSMRYEDLMEQLEQLGLRRQQELAAAIAEREEFLEAQNRQIDEQEAAAAEQRSRAAAVAASIEELEQVLSAKQKALSELERKVAYQRRQLEQLTGKVEEQRSAARTWQQEVQQLQQKAQESQKALHDAKSQKLMIERNILELSRKEQALQQDRSGPADVRKAPEPAEELAVDRSSPS